MKFILSACFLALAGVGCSGGVILTGDAVGDVVLPDDADVPEDSLVDDAAAEAPLTWAKAYSGLRWDDGLAVTTRSDGGFVLAGLTESFSEGRSDAWILALGAGGEILWEKSFGGELDDQAAAVTEGLDGSIVAAGSTSSYSLGFNDGWIIALSAEGDILWQKHYTGEGDEGFTSIRPTSDGGYITAGWTATFGRGGSDMWIVKLTATGDIIWQNAYGGPEADYGHDVRQMPDGGYIAAGDSRIVNGSFVVVRLDADGHMLWAKRYSGEGDDYAYGVALVEEGRVIVAGMTESFPFVTGNWNLWLLGLDEAGAVAWQWSVGGGDKEWGTAIEPAAGGGAFIAGWADSFGAGFEDFWIVKVDADGEILWNKSYGGNQEDKALAICATGDGGAVAAGRTYSFGDNSYNMMAVRFDASGNILQHCPSRFAVNTSASILETDVLAQDASLERVESEAGVRSTTASAAASRASVSPICTP